MDPKSSSFEEKNGNGGVAVTGAYDEKDHTNYGYAHHDQGVYADRVAAGDPLALNGEYRRRRYGADKPYMLAIRDRTTAHTTDRGEMEGGVKRQLKQRHMAMIAIGGAIGTGESRYRFGALLPCGVLSPLHTLSLPLFTTLLDAIPVAVELRCSVRITEQCPG